LISFYSLPSSILGHKTHKILRAAYSFYNVSKATPLKALMQDALILANNVCLVFVSAFSHLLQLGYDVFNCLDVMDNSTFLSDLKFGPGDGNVSSRLFLFFLFFLCFFWLAVLTF
jgi:glycylpeptide N-tetradecanoyltransferase